MDEPSVDERLARLEERLRRLEHQLGMPPIPPVAKAPSIPPEPLPHRVAPPPIPERYRTPRIDATARETEAPTVPVRPIPVVPLSEFAKPASGTNTLEALVGLKWAGWVGAIIVVIGAALGIKFAYDHHWFAIVSPAVRLALMSLGGFALIAAGEVVYRRIGAVAAAALFGAGVATLFVVSYAGYGIYGLYNRDAAFIGMALVTLVGSAVAIRGDMVSIAVLSIVGGNIAPLVLHSDEPRLVPLMAYLLMMQVVALFLAWRGRSPKWWTLRGVAFITICLWMALPVGETEQFPGDPRTQVLAFVLVYAALFHLELVLSSLRDPKPVTTREAGFAVPVPLGRRDGVAEQRRFGVTFSLLVTAALTIAVLNLVWDRPEIYRGAWMIGLGACCLGLGVLLLRFVRRRDPLAPPSAALALSVGYRIQAAALLVVAVPVTLSGVWITVAWAVLAIAFAVAGAILDLAVSRLAAVLVWMLAVGHLGVWTLGAFIVGGGGGTGPLAVWAIVLGQTIPAFLILATLMAVVGHAIAAIVRENFSVVSVARDAPDDSPASTNLNYESATTAPPRAQSSRAFQSLASVADALAVLAFVAAAFAALPPLGTTFALLCYGWVLVGAGQVILSPEMQPAGLLLILTSAAKWLLFDTLRERLLLGVVPAAASVYRPVYNPVVAVGAALFISGLVLLRVPLNLQRFSRRVRSETFVRSIGGFGAVVVLLWLMTIEIDRYFATRGGGGADAARAEQFAISIFWSLYAVVCVVLGFARRVAGLRYFGLTLFAITIGKVMLVDLSAVQTGYRILSFLGLGLLLLGTSVLYGKLSPLLLADPAPLPSPESDGQEKDR